MVDDRSMYEMERDTKLEQVAEMEKELAGIESGYSIFPLAQFERQGLPILAGLVDDTFDPTAWVDYVGHHHVGLKVVNADLTEVIYTIPPLMGQLVAMPNSDPNAPTLNDEITHLNYIKEVNPQGASAMLLETSTRGLAAAHPTREQDMMVSAAGCYAVLNKIFSDFDLPLLEVPDVLTGIVKDESKVEVSRVEEHYDIDEGEDF